MSEVVLACRDLGRSYVDGALRVDVLRDVNLELLRGEKMAVIGASGSGKSTLLNLLGGLDTPTTGSVSIAGADLSRVGESELCRLRNSSIGFVYQFHHLLQEFDALENVCMPLLIAGMARGEASDRAAHLLQRVGLAQRIKHRPGQLSGGERQRVAIARALVNQPACVLMDEPTGNLDPGSASQVMGLIDELQSEQAAFVIVTHDAEIAGHMGRVCELRCGDLVEHHGGD